VTAGSGVPVDIDRDTAQQAAARELAKPEYAAARPSPAARAWRWLVDEITELLDHASQRSPHGYLGLIALVVVLLLVIVAVRLRLGRIGRGAGRPGGLLGSAEVTTADHRRAADAHAAVGEWAEALRERLRAVACELEEQDLLQFRPGRTAAELAAEAGRALPGHADQLRRAAEEFADVWYGGRPASPEMDARVRELDAAVSRAAGVLTGVER
jgi:hypothetical protein